MVPSDFEWFCPILDFSVWFLMILSTFEWFNQWRHLNTVWINLFLGDIMQLQFMKSALTVNPCMVSGLSMKQCVPQFLMTEILIIAELAEHSPIILQNGSSNLSSRKNLDLWPYDCTTIQSVTFTCMVNCTTGTLTPWLCPVVQWSVHWAASWTTRVLVLAGARHCALETGGKKKRAPLLDLAKSIY